MSDRYFVEQPIDSDRARLTGGEAHHLAHVMRGRPGQQVVLFDGSGREFVARIESIARSDVELEVLSSAAVDREPRTLITLGVAFPKGDRQKWLIEKATELGVHKVVPLVTARSVAKVGPTAIDRLRRGVVEASKQCGRARLMEIAEPRPLASFAVDFAVQIKLAAQPGGQPMMSVLGELAASPPAESCLAIGPEGGFTDEELAHLADSRWKTVDLGTRVLRVETAAVLLAGLVALAGVREQEGRS